MGNNIDILLDANDDDLIKDGDYAIGDGTQDDCNIILKLNAGALKSDPILGPNLVKMINSKKSPTEIIQIIKLHLARDNKSANVSIVNGLIDIKI